jgi:thiamine biosynthesis protein ThiS
METVTLQLTVNGKAHTHHGGTFVSDLLAALGLAGKPVVVELNGNALRPADHAITEIPDRARLELVTLAAGG